MDCLTIGRPAKLLEGNWLHDVTVLGQGAGFVSVRLGEATRLVRRHAIYALPEEQPRLQQDIQNAIKQLGHLQDELARSDDVIPFIQE